VAERRSQFTLSCQQTVADNTQSDDLLIKNLEIARLQDVQKTQQSDNI